MDKNQQILNRLIKIAKKASCVIKNTKTNVYAKGENDLVTDCDFQAEKYINSQLNKFYPNIPIVSEEFNDKVALSDECFTVDPIAGTINFANNIPCWGIQIAYRNGGKTTAGVIYIPTLKEIYYAYSGGGAFMNGKPIKAKIMPLEKCIWVIDAGSRKPLRKKISEAIQNNTFQDRRFGSVCSSFSFLAKGRIQAVVFLKKTPWDIEPGRIICQEAGVLFYETNELIVCSSSQELLRLIKNAIID